MDWREEESSKQFSVFALIPQASKMIRSYFGLTENPFAMRDIELLPHQQEVHDTLRVHCQQGGLCVIVGRPGTGKTVIKESLKRLPEKDHLVATVARTLHTYTNTVKILCEAFRIEFESNAFKCERKLIQEAVNLNRSGKMLVTIIDDAHLMEMENLRKLRLLLEDFPKNHNLILIGHVELLSNMDLAVNQDIKSRITYSVVTRRLHDDVMREFIHRELERIGLAHSTFTSSATELIIRSADGVLRRCRNLCISSMLEAVRAAAGRTIDIDIVNRVLMQPHWHNEVDLTDF
jgi:MSHA biogenesis protein MshM